MNAMNPLKTTWLQIHVLGRHMLEKTPAWKMTRMPLPRGISLCNLNLFCQCRFGGAVDDSLNGVFVRFQPRQPTTEGGKNTQDSQTLDDMKTQSGFDDTGVHAIAEIGKSYVIDTKFCNEQG